MKWQFGLTLKKEKFNDFKKDLENSIEKSDIIPIIYIDKELKIKNLKTETIEELHKLEPFGAGNKAPQFVFKNMKIISLKTLSEGKHLKLILQEESNTIEAIGFNLGKYSEDYLIGDKIDVVGHVENNSYNGENKLQINMKDIMKSLG